MHTRRCAPVLGRDDLLAARELVLGAAQRLRRLRAQARQRERCRQKARVVSLRARPAGRALTALTSLQRMDIRIWPMATRAQVPRGLPNAPRMPCCSRSAPAHESILLMRRTWYGCTRMRMWKDSLPAFFTMYLLAAIRAASSASEPTFSFSKLEARETLGFRGVQNASSLRAADAPDKVHAVGEGVHAVLLHAGVIDADLGVCGVAAAAAPGMPSRQQHEPAGQRTAGAAAATSRPRCVLHTQSGAQRGREAGRRRRPARQALAWPDRAGVLRCAAGACARRARPRRATAVARATAKLRGCRRASRRGCVASKPSPTEKHVAGAAAAGNHARNAQWPTPASVAAHERTRHAAAEARLGVRLVLDDPVAPEGCAIKRGRVRRRPGAAARRAQRTSAAHGDGGARCRTGRSRKTCALCRSRNF